MSDPKLEVAAAAGLVAEAGAVFVEVPNPEPVVIYKLEERINKFWYETAGSLELKDMSS